MIFSILFSPLRLVLLSPLLTMRVGIPRNHDSVIKSKMLVAFDVFEFYGSFLFTLLEFVLENIYYSTK